MSFGLTAKNIQDMVQAQAEGKGYIVYPWI